MSLNLPAPGLAYDMNNEAQARASLEREDLRNVKKGTFCAFNAYLAADTSSDKTGDNTAYTVICGTELFDLGKNYDPATGLFTAPLAGEYHFSATCQANNVGAAHTNGSLRLVTSLGKTYVGNVVNPFAASVSGIAGMMASATIQLAAGETVAMSLLVAGGAKTVGVYSATPGTFVVTHFSGHLVSRI